MNDMNVTYSPWNNVWTMASGSMLWIQSSDWVGNTHNMTGPQRNVWPAVNIVIGEQQLVNNIMPISLHSIDECCLFPRQPNPMSVHRSYCLRWKVEKNPLGLNLSNCHSDFQHRVIHHHHQALLLHMSWSYAKHHWVTKNGPRWWWITYYHPQRAHNLATTAHRYQLMEMDLPWLFVGNLKCCKMFHWWLVHRSSLT